MQVIYQKACGIDVHKSFIVAVICDSTSAEPKYIRKRFSTYQNSLIQFRNGLFQTIVKTYAWKVLANTISLFTMRWKDIFPTSSLPILNGLELSKARKMIRKMPNGLLIFLNLASLEAVLFPLKTFVFLESLLAIFTNLPA